MQPYVAESRRAEEGVAKGMEGYIGIAVPEKPFFKRYVDAAYYAPSALDKAVYVKAVAYSKKFRFAHCCLWFIGRLY